MEHYFQGHWNDARKTLERILALDETDADALMQLATIYVHTGQPAAQGAKAFAPVYSSWMEWGEVEVGDRAVAGHAGQRLRAASTKAAFNLPRDRSAAAQRWQATALPN